MYYTHRAAYCMTFLPPGSSFGAFYEKGYSNQNEYLCLQWLRKLLGDAEIVEIKAHVHTAVAMFVNKNIG